MEQIQKALREANQQVEGTGELLEQAADEIVRLKHQASLDKAKIVALRTALEEARTDLNELVGLLLGTVTAINQDLKQMLVGLSEMGERTRQTEQTIRDGRDATNQKILQALK